MSDLQEAVARAAVGALATIEADRKNVRYLTCEIELRDGVPVDARAWVERGVNLGEPLGVGRG